MAPKKGKKTPPAVEEARPAGGGRDNDQARESSGIGEHTVPSAGRRFTEFLTRPTGIVAALVVVLGLGSAVFTLSGQLRGLLFNSGPSPDSLAVVDQPQTSGRAWQASSDVLAPYGVTLPAIDNFYGCGSAEPTFLRDWTPLRLYERLSLENTAPQSAGAIQVLNIRATVLSTSPARPGVVIECENSQGINSIGGKIRAADNDVAVTTGADGKDQQPLAFTLAGGEQQVINLTVDAMDQDVTLDLVADLVIAGQTFTKKLTTSPVTVHSAAAGAPYSYGWGGKGWLCRSRGTPSTTATVPENLRGLCDAGKVFTQQDLSPTLQTTFAGSWTGHTRSLTVSPQGRVHEEVYSGCCTPELTMDYQLTSVTGTSPTEATATGQVTAVKAGPNTGAPPPAIGSSITLTRHGDQITDSITDASFCKPKTQGCGA